MNTVLKVRTTYQNYYVANTINLPKAENNNVVIQTPNGQEIGQVIDCLSMSSAVQTDDSPFQLLRQATVEDLEKNAKNNARKREFQKKFQRLTAALNLEMRLVDVHISFNRDKVTFFYISDTRIDFRELVKKLASDIKARIELRQLNERDRAKLVGGIGPCGYELCCSRFLKEFTTVNVKMAKIQQLSFNLQRVTGLCDRLLCCLKYEHAQYIEMKKEVPDLNQRITLNDGRTAKVNSLQLISRNIVLKYEDQSVETFDFEAFFAIYNPASTERGKEHENGSNQ